MCKIVQDGVDRFLFEIDLIQINALDFVNSPLLTATTWPFEFHFLAGVFEMYESKQEQQNSKCLKISKASFKTSVTFST